MLETVFGRMAGCARSMLWLLGACLLAPGLAAAAPRAVRELDIADYRAYLAEDHPVRQGMRRFAQLVEAGGDGSLRVRVRRDAPGGTPARQLAALRAGQAGAPALMLVAGTGLAPLAPAFELLDLPYLVRDEAQADALLDGPFGDALLARLGRGDAAGLTGLAWWENGFRQVTTSRGPIRGAADLRGLRMRVIGEPVFVETARALGATPVPLPFEGLREALRTRRVDAQDNFSSQILAGRLHEVQSSLTLTNHSYSALVLVANAAAWNGLSDAQRQLLRTAAREAGQFQRRVARAQADRAHRRLERAGLAVHPLSATAREQLRTLTAPLRERTFDRHGDALWRLYLEHGGAR
jgi:tripartite ATP-independent transporter DctP family solute receptor